MNARFLLALAIPFSLATFAVGAAEPTAGDRGIFDQAAVDRADDDAPVQTGVAPQGRGPVHEAFATPAVDAPKPGPVVAKQPPEAIEELPPSEKPEGEDVQWVPGYWGFDDERGGFVWVSGIWRAVPPGRQWVPGHWAQAAGGWQWTSGFWAGADGGEVAVVPAPPDPQPETPATAPTSDSTFVPGNYVYRQNQFVWQPGTYVANRPGFVWVPAHYVYTPCGYIFVDGYWDYDVQGRGLLFAPVVIDAAHLAQADFVYTPEYVVHDVCLLDALFVRPDCGCYYYGDYFDPGYARLGFVSWFDYRFGRHGFDPLFGYYRWSHRHDRGWENGLRALYRARTRTGIGRPPRTLARQQALARNLLAAGNRDALRHGVLLGRLSRLDRGVVKLRTLNRAGQLRQRQLASQVRDAGRRREQAEARLLAQGRSALGKGGTAQKLPLRLSKSFLGNQPGKTPPPPGGLKTTTRLTGNAGGNRLGNGSNANALQTGRTGNFPGTTTGRLGGAKVNTVPVPGLGNISKLAKPVTQTLSPGNGAPTGGRLNSGGARQNFTPPGGPRTQSATLPKPPTFSPGTGSPAGGRTNTGGPQNFRPSGGSGTFNPTPPGRTFQTASSQPARTFSRPPSQTFSRPPAQTFSSQPSRTSFNPPGRNFSSPPARTFGGSGGRTFGGGGGGRRR